MQDRITKHDREYGLLVRNPPRFRSTLTKRGIFLFGIKEVKFIERDPHWYTRRVKEAIDIHITLHPSNINRDSRIEIPEAWIPTTKKAQQPINDKADV